HSVATSINNGIAYVFNGAIYAYWWVNYGVIKRCETITRNFYCDTFYYHNDLFYYEKRVSIIPNCSEKIRSTKLSIQRKLNWNSRDPFICERARRKTASQNSK